MASPSSPNQLVSNSPTGEIEEIEDSIDKQFKSFKNFDVLTNPPLNHRFFNAPPPSGECVICPSFVTVTKTDKSSNFQLQKRMVSEEWEILRNNLPNSIFVRAYSRRVDLLRVAIIGLDRRRNGDIDDNSDEIVVGISNISSNNPYSYGLFFFDVYFPPRYPDKPPLVSHIGHGGGVSSELHSNKFFVKNRRRSQIHGLPTCLKTKRTTKSDSKWDPAKSNVLEVLRFIQDQVLQRPPEIIDVQKVNEIFEMSHKAMVSTLQTPPRGFEGFVRGYFRKYSHVILARFKDFMAKERERLTKNGSMGSTRTTASNGTSRLTFELLLKAFEDNGSYCQHINVHS